jgi:hypothetical protein
VDAGHFRTSIAHNMMIASTRQDPQSKPHREAVAVWCNVAVTGNANEVSTTADAKYTATLTPGTSGPENRR